MPHAHPSGFPSPSFMLGKKRLLFSSGPTDLKRHRLAMEIAGDRPPRYGENRDQEGSPTGENRDREGSPTGKPSIYETPSLDSQKKLDISQMNTL